ncbi:amino acid adenylation domain-containing protein [Microcoleus sp. FACHB-SPT15]|uniref:non-ribosomal peptide synthetase n=1 Tax=Microcoleus sp. FACHB-SPT15 TaxID=2692830 RepID=UPI00178025D4|nr:non-ribosomal peptide synthetase [Microcoleus sp. FACHB-SPT15]MBD1806825.1 amino acid adenylation domain-containing protein [Microcoleus sp. FACHB-SPT15]
MPLTNTLFSQKIYWLNQLSGELPETNLITDYIRPVLYTGKHQSVTFDLSNDSSESIFRLTQKSNFSIYLVLLSALNLLLYRYTGNNDVIVGSPVYRPDSSYEGSNTIVPLRSKVKNQVSCKDFLLHVKDSTIGAYSHYYPFDDLVQLLKLPKTQNRCPIFDIILLLNNIHDKEAIADVNNDLTIELVVDSNRIYGKIEYNESLFREDSIKILARHYIKAIQGFIEDINSKVSDVNLLDEFEKHQLLESFNDNTGEYPVHQTLHYLFEEQVRRTPAKMAASFGETRLTYQDLNHKANQLARCLQNLGLEKGDFVGILKERDINFLIAILAVLKAGGVYIPIDSTYPLNRIQYMLSNSEVRILLTDSSFLEGLRELLELGSHLKSIVCLDVKPDNLESAKPVGVNICDRNDFEQFPKDNLEGTHKGTDPAYMLYTSGSTGLPKGAIIRHGGAINHIYAQFDALEFNENFSFLQSAPASSDISVWQFLAPILIGGRTVIIDTETVCNPERLFKVIQDERLSIVELVPVVLRELLNYISRLPMAQRALPDLKWMMVTGESVSVELVNQWLRLYPSIKVVNAYGPTEAADDITQSILDKPLPENQRTVPIGKPLANLTLHILDQDMQLVPIGVPGEICVSGFGVGVGYWKNEERTQLSFVPNPFPNPKKVLPGIDSDVIYKTGDLGRWLPDGSIEFLGRIDHQVKIRGFRIELGEIEALLSQHPAVRETVVVVREDVPNQKRLVAYIVPDEQPENPKSNELRNFLKDRLPEHMVPSAFVLLETLPLTPSGKVDRRALPAPDSAQPQSDETFTAPRTPIEESLANIWAQVLGLDRVGIHDNFFELGGDSILCIQVIAKAHQAELNLTPKQLFQNQTIAELAKVVGTSQVIAAEQGLVTGEVPLTPIQHYFFEQNQPDSHQWNEAVLLEVKQALDPRLLEQAVRQLLIHHDALRLRFERTESNWTQINAEPDETVPFSWVDLSGIAAEKQASALETTASELQASLNLSCGLLVRVALFNLGAEKTNRLLLIIHHIAVDSLSWRILVEDLETIYQQLSQGKTITLPAKTTSFQQWAQQLREYANSAVVQQELDYWLSSSRKPISRLPVDYPDGVNTQASARTVSITLSSAETKALLQDVPAVYRTQIDDVLLTALVHAFANWTGERSLLVNREGHGREEIFDNVDLSRTVGLFSSIFPMLLDLGEASNSGEALKAVKEQLRSIPNRGIGYGLLRYLSDNREIVESLRSLPSAEVVFNYLGQFDQTLAESSLFKLAHESTGSSNSPRNYRAHLLSFTAYVVGGQLQLSCAYSEAVHRQSTIEALIQGFVAQMRSLIAHCQSPDAGGYTPSDFPLAKLTQQKLDELLGSSRQIEDIYPLSSIQQGILFHTLYAKEVGVYFEQMLFTIRGNPNISALKQAWEQLIASHPVLRTSFHWENLDSPLQIVHQRVELPWQQYDWRMLSSVEQQEQLETFLHSDRKQGFEFSQAPLMRLTLIQVAKDDYYFIWSNHHLLIDGWSIPLLFKEILTSYQAFHNGQTLSLEPCYPYRNYITWLQQQDLSQSEAFWRKMLKGFTTPTPVGQNRTTGSRLDHKQGYDKQAIELSTATTTDLQSLARKYQLTLNTLVQGAWALLLSLSSGESDVVFGATVSGRPPTLVGAESIVGVFINTLPVRVQVTPDELLPSWLKNLQEQQVEARQYEHTPLVQVHKCSDVPQDLPLFESIVVFQNLPVDSSLSQGVTDLEVHYSHSITRNSYPLTLRVVLGARWSLQILYECDRFEAATIKQKLGQLETLLSKIVFQPDVKLGELIEILTEANRKQQLIKEKETEKASLQKLKLTRRKAIRT